MYTLIALPYAFNALEPYIDSLTMEIHYTKHYAGYINNLNLALVDYPELQKKSVLDLLINLNNIDEKVRTVIRNNAGGAYNHELFWQMMTPNSIKKPIGNIAKEIDKYFGSFTSFKETFNNAAKSRFGSGWAWLCLNEKNDLIIISTSNQDSPLTNNLRPILGLDVWEHAYYLKYQNRRVEYIDSWWNIVNWDFVEELFNKN